MHWAARSTWYHVLIDRFATGPRSFVSAALPARERSPGGRLSGWMGGNLPALTHSLDYLQELGIGVLLLSPFFASAAYHGYWVTDLEKVEPRFGTRRDLRQLIQQAHRRDIRVMMDLPLTHCHRDAVYWRSALRAQPTSRRKWFVFDEHRQVAGFYGDVNLPEFNLDDPGLTDFLKRVVSDWLGLGIDGIRFDHAKRPSPGFWEDFTGYLSSRHPGVLLLGENWHESGQVGCLSPYLHGELNIPISRALSAFLRRPGRRSVERVGREIRGQAHFRRADYLLPTFLDNHDLERAAHLAAGDPNLLALGYLIQLTLPCPPVIYYGSERGQTQTEDPPPGVYGRDCFFREPMDWRRGRRMRDWVGRLIHFRNRFIDWFMTEPVVTKTEPAGCPRDRTFAYSYQHNGKVIIVVLGLGPGGGEFRLPWPMAQGLTTAGCRIGRAVDGHPVLRMDGWCGAVLLSESEAALPDARYASTSGHQ